MLNIESSNKYFISKMRKYLFEISVNNLLIQRHFIRIEVQIHGKHFKTHKYDILHERFAFTPYLNKVNLTVKY